MAKKAKKHRQTKTFSLGRDSKTGRFVPVSEAKRRPATTTVERIPKAGHGDTARVKRTSGRTAAGKKTGSGGPRKGKD